MTPSLATIYSGELEGIHAKIVEVEVDLQVGLHSFMIVGLADKAVNEARERVSGALKNSGAKPPNRENRKITVNLAPANVRKSGAQHDLAIAIGYLLATKQMRRSFPTNKILFAGELALSGRLRKIRGALNIAALAQRFGFATLVIPRANGREASHIRGLQIIAANSLREVIDVLENKIEPPRLPEEIENDGKELSKEKTEAANNPRSSTVRDFSEIKGQAQAKRALMIAAAGRHNVIMVGPPGVGKSMLGNALAGILPPLSTAEAIEVTQIHSAVGIAAEGLITNPPFRAPHHTASLKAMLGGGTVPRPGEITLAHRGILFLDELPEFPARTLESLRGPMESRTIQVARLHGHMVLPADFMLVAAMNPCPCGYYGDSEKVCRCTAYEVTKYQKKISGPFLDRIDLQLTLKRADAAELAKPAANQPAAGNNESEVIRKEIEKARAFAEQRKRQETKTVSGISNLSSRAQRFLDTLRPHHLSARSHYRLLKTARTIADLEAAEQISELHLAEAFSYRFRENEKTPNHD